MKVPTLDLVRFGKIGFFLETVIFSEFAVWYVRRHSSWQAHKHGEVCIYSRDTWPLLNASLLGWKQFWEAHMGSTGVITQKLLRRLSGIVTISNGLKNLYRGFGVAEEKIYVAPDAIDLKDFEISVSQSDAREAAHAKLGLLSYHLPVDTKIVMYIGLFDEWKGYKTLLDASRLIDPAFARIALIGGTEKQIAELTKEYPHAIFLGYRAYTELATNQKAADLLVIPNSAKYLISKYYTSPLKLFAHMASGVPILASDIPSIKEIVDEHDAAFFAPDDAQDLARMIVAVLADPEVKNRAENAKKKVSKYTWSARGKNILEFIDQHI